MRKLLFTLSLTVILSGCLGENQRVKIRRDAEEIAPVASTTEEPWWRTPYYADTPRDENPWLEFVRPQEDNWHDPWERDPLSNYGVEPLQEQIRRLGRPSSKTMPEAARKETNPDNPFGEYREVY